MRTFFVGAKQFELGKKDISLLAIMLACKNVVSPMTNKYDATVWSFLYSPMNSFSISAHRISN